VREAGEKIRREKKNEGEGGEKINK